jgi:hypothetical protein
MDLQESSGNFDLENVRPFLERIKPLIESGFADAEINQIQKATEEMEVDEEKISSSRLSSRAVTPFYR